MLNNHNNIINRFFKATTALWRSAAEYQVYAALAAIALPAILILFAIEKTDTAGTVLNLAIFCAMAAAGFALLRLKGSQLAAFTFAAALILRLCLVFAFEKPSPYMCNDDRVRTYRWIRHYDSAILQADEFFYAYHTQDYKDTTAPEFINLPEFAKNAYRTSFLMSRILRLFGDDFTWLRIFGAFLGAFSAAIVTLAAEKLFSRNTSTIISLLCVIAPQTAFYSVRFLKEIWIIFAASLMIFGFAAILRNKKLFSAVLSIAASAIILFWFRFEYGLMSITTIPIAVCFRHRGPSMGKNVAIISMIFLAAVLSFYKFNQLTYRAENTFDRYLLTERGQKGTIESVNALDKIYKSHGPLRLLNIPLSLLNPPPKNPHHTFAPANGLHDIVLQADIWQWWLGLPFLIIGSIIIISRRTEFIPFLLPYLAVIIISAILHGGLLPVVYRFRDSLAPAAFIIIGVGIESLLTAPQGWKNRIFTGVSAVFALLAVYLYTKGF